MSPIARLTPSAAATERQRQPARLEVAHRDPHDATLEVDEVGDRVPREDRCEHQLEHDQQHDRDGALPEERGEPEPDDEPDDGFGSIDRPASIMDLIGG